MKTTEILLKSNFRKEFDTPKKLNRSTKEVPASVINDLEAGNFTCENIEALTRSYPIFRYYTCITIHGFWPEISRSYIGRYKNVIQNKNGSVEIRYSAIDRTKIIEIRRLLNATKTEYSGFQYLENSLNRVFRLSNRLTAENYTTKVNEYKAILNRVSTANIYGNSSLYVVSDWGMKTLILDISPLAIPQTEVQNFALLMLGLTETEYNLECETASKINEQAEQERTDRHDKWELERKEKQIALDLLNAQRIEPMKKEIELLPECNDINKGILVTIFEYSHCPGISDLGYSSYEGRDYIKSLEGQFLFYFIKLNGKGSFGNVKRSFAVSPSFDMDNLKWFNRKQVKESDLPKLKGYKLAYENEAEQPKIKPENRIFSKPIAKTEAKITDVSLLRYSDKAYAIFGNTKPIKDKLSAIGGRFNMYLTNPQTGTKQAGWVFPASKFSQLQNLI